jgi:hypothetical protein
MPSSSTCSSSISSSSSIIPCLVRRKRHR